MVVRRGRGQISALLRPICRRRSELGFVTLTVLMLEGLARGVALGRAPGGAALLPASLLVAVMLSVVRSGHPLAGWMAAALPIAIVVHSLLLRAHERVVELPADPGVAVLLEDLVMFRHLSVWWLLAGWSPRSSTGRSGGSRRASSCGRGLCGRCRSALRWAWR